MSIVEELNIWLSKRVYNSYNEICFVEGLNNILHIDLFEIDQVYKNNIPNYPQKVDKMEIITVIKYLMEHLELPLKKHKIGKFMIIAGENKYYFKLLDGDYKIIDYIEK